MIRCRVTRKSYIARKPGAIEEFIDPQDSDPFVVIDETKMAPGDNLQPVDQHGNPVEASAARTLHPAVVPVAAVPAAPAPALAPAPAASSPPPPPPPPPAAAAPRRGRPPGTRNRSR